VVQTATANNLITDGDLIIFDIGVAGGVATGLTAYLVGQG
jgi:hypothetical protein